jgi:putative acetyltransferase
MQIRSEKSGDMDKVWEINVAAFETDTEAKLVNALRESGVSYISLVAEVTGELVGHILFTPVELVDDGSGLKLMGLGPMAVMPKYQNKGIGSQLVKEGLEHCLRQGYDAVVVLGHPEYYPRFGFVPSIKYGIKSEYEVPDEAFMILELKKNSLKGKSGVIKYNPAFGSV